MRGQGDSAMEAEAAMDAQTAMNAETASEGPILRGDEVTLRPLVAADKARVLEILLDPEVARWWGAGDLAGSVEDLYAPDVAGFAIELDGAMVGCIQYAEESDPEYRHAGIDLFLAREGRGHSFGPDAIRVLARYLFDARGHHRLTIDPAASNERAIRAYERVGFRRIGIMRQYEQGPDGTYHDGLLMDMLRGELA
jgi:aminoglycoside 6'-N-acetyltransferase